MKKNLLLVAAFAVGMNVMAQSHIHVDGTTFEGVTSDKNATVSLEAGTLLGETDDMKMSVAFTTNHIYTDLKATDFDTFVFDGTEISSKNGLQGQDNPKDVDGGTPANTLKEPVSGAVVQIDAKKDGFVYVWAKLSCNKQYTVFEEGSAISYQLAAHTATFGYTEYTAPCNEDGFVTDTIQKIAVIISGDPTNACKDNGMGVIKFQVFAGSKYYVNANGSKISFGGAWFDPEGDVVVGLKHSETGATFGLLGADASIDGIIDTNVVAEEFFTVAGQKASAAATGIVLVKKTFADGSVKTVKVIR